VRARGLSSGDKRSKSQVSDLAKQTTTVVRGFDSDFERLFTKSTLQISQVVESGKNVHIFLYIMIMRNDEGREKSNGKVVPEKERIYSKHNDSDEHALGGERTSKQNVSPQTRNSLKTYMLY